MADVLLTNDDGYKSVGFLSLLKEMSRQFSVAAVAPPGERSWIGKSITARQALELKKVKAGGFDVFSLSGTPADCVQVGLYGALDKKPKLVVSGINLGDNLGHAQTLSSGTVGAAMEASLDGVKSIAAALCIPPEIRASTDFFDAKNSIIFENAAKITTKLAAILVKKDFGAGVDLISLNIPFGATVDTPFAVTAPFRGPYGKLFQKRGDSFIHVNPYIAFRHMQSGHLQEGTDAKAVAEGKISVAPLSLELVSNDALKRVEQLIIKSW